MDEPTDDGGDDDVCYRIRSRGTWWGPVRLKGIHLWHMKYQGQSKPLSRRHVLSLEAGDGEI